MKKTSLLWIIHVHCTKPISTVKGRFLFRPHNKWVILLMKSLTAILVFLYFVTPIILRLNPWIFAEVTFLHRGLLNWQSHIDWLICTGYVESQRVFWYLNWFNRFSRSFLINLTNLYNNWEKLWLSSAEMIIKKCWISQSKTSMRTIHDVINIIRCSMHWLADWIYIPTNEPCRAFGCDLIIWLQFY